MKKLLIVTSIGIIILFLTIISESAKSTSMIHSSYQDSSKTINEGENMDFDINKSENEWKKVLTPEQYRVLREKGTERPFTGKFYENKQTGVYVCAACGNELFSSDTKYESGSGWPSYWKPVSNNSVKLIDDYSLGMFRTEVVCAKCGSHLGHVFDDGPQPTGKRYCINSISLEFDKDSTKK